MIENSLNNGGELSTSNSTEMTDSISSNGRVELISANATITTSSTTTTNTSRTNETNEPVHVKPKVNFKVDIPRISSRDLHAQQLHTQVDELEQIGFLCNGNGSKRDLNKLNLKIKTLELEECVKRAKKFAMEQSVRFALVKQQQQQQKQQLDLIKKQQAILLMCRVYVGSIFYEVKEETVRLSFAPFGPIRSISMSWDAATNKHKGFAFIEFETPEAAQMSLDQMNGILLGGRNIKVGRPSNMPQAQPIIDQLIEDAKNYNRIYVASIHPNLSEQDVQSVFEAFGTIKSCALVRDSQTGKHKGYGFIEYETAQAAQDAIASMNLFDLGGQFLRVGKAITPPEQPVQPIQPVMPTPSPIITNPNVLAAVAAASTINSQLTSAQEASTAALVVKTGVANSATVAPAAALTTPATASSLVNSPGLLSTSLPQTTGSPVVSNQTTVNTTTPTLPINQQATQPGAALISPNNLIAAQNAANQVLQSQANSNDPNKIELTENQKKLLGMTSSDDPSASLEQQVDITLKNKEQRLILMQKLMQRKQESTVLLLKNMVTPDEVDEDLENEITDECEKYGQVSRVVIYQEKQGESDDAEVIVKIFVQFDNPKSVEKAVESLNGRFFAGRVVKAEIYDQNSYDSKDYSG